MTLNPFRDETSRPVEPTLSQLEHQVGACQSSAFVLTLEGLPEQAAAYLARAALFEVQLGQLRQSRAPAFAPSSPC
jgi:hypothetical protein